MVICLERGANDLHIIQLMSLPPISLAPVKSRIVYLCGAGVPRLSWKNVVKRSSSNSNIKIHKMQVGGGGRSKS